ncbi:MAG TPA: DUF1501 domain-containing protein [Planctomycetaceae bacterium]|nr:DUF1501 domain-containing protein [Planctomycetaceae bacterium]
MPLDTLNRRDLLQTGAAGLLAASAAPSWTFAASTQRRSKSVIYIFLSGGLAQHDSFDMKPSAPDNVRGEFQPIATRTPGLQVCEHLPLLAQRSHLWSLCRSLTHPTNDHSAGHHIMLTGRTMLPPGFDPAQPKPSDWPSIAAVAGAVTPPRNGLPPAVVLPEKLIHTTRRVIPGQFAGHMGPRRDPWFIEAAPYESVCYGAYPDYAFDHQDRPNIISGKRDFRIPDITLTDGISRDRLDHRLALLRNLEQHPDGTDSINDEHSFVRSQQGAVSFLTDPRIKQILDVRSAKSEQLDRYGRNSFGWSLLMARNLVEAGVNFVQVNLGNNETWDTHGEAFPHLKDKLFPPTDKALSALLDDLNATGLLNDTLIVMAGEFGRTPKVTHLPQHYKLPGRDHWGAVQTVFFAGGGVQGGRVIGASDKIGAYPASDAQKPENMAATMYAALGLPDTTAWYDDLKRPHHIYEASPILGLF